MNKSIYILTALAFLFVLMPMGSADLGTVKPYQCINLLFPINATAVNITIQYPNLTNSVTDAGASQTGTGFNYTYCGTSALGSYPYTYCDQLGTCFGNKFKVGDEYGFWITLILGISGVLLFAMGVYTHNGYIGTISGIVFLVLGVYGVINGFGFINNLYSQAIAYTAMGLGILFFVAGAYEIVADEEEGGSEEE